MVKSLLLSPVRFGKALLRSIRLWFLLVLALYGMLFIFELPPFAERALHILLIISCFIQLGISGSMLMKESLEEYIQKKAEHDSSWRSAQGLIQLGLQVLLWSLVLLLTLDNLGIDITALITGLGIGGIAAALAINNILGDLFASLSILLDKPFEAGDFVIVGDMMGTVEQIGIKSTRIRSIAGEQIIFSNSDLLGSRIKNYKRMQERRVVFQVGVTYETDKEKLKQIAGWIRSIIEGQESVRFDRSHFKAFGAYSLDFETVYYVLAPEYALFMDIQQQINYQLFEKFAAEGVEFAYPTQVEIHRQEEPVLSST